MSNQFQSSYRQLAEGKIFLNIHRRREKVENKTVWEWHNWYWVSLERTEGETWCTIHNENVHCRWRHNAKSSATWVCRECVWEMFTALISLIDPRAEYGGRRGFLIQCVDFYRFILPLISLFLLRRNSIQPVIGLVLVRTPQDVQVSYASPRPEEAHGLCECSNWALRQLECFWLKPLRR